MGSTRLDAMPSKRISRKVLGNVQMSPQSFALGM